MTDHTTIVIFGASGDLALKKTFPSLYELYLSSLLPANTLIVGYARSSMTDVEARGKWGNYLKAGTEVDRAAFLKLCVYRSGGYGDTAAFSKVRVGRHKYIFAGVVKGFIFHSHNYTKRY